MCVLLDGLKGHILSVYGNDCVKRPSVNAFSERSVLVAQHYVGSIRSMACNAIWRPKTGSRCGVLGPPREEVALARRSDQPTGHRLLPLL